MPGLWASAPKQMRSVWGSAQGQRMWYALRGYETDAPETARRTVGHSHVPAPARRAPEQARLVGRRLTLKAASRLRRMDYQTRRLSLGGRFDGEQGRWHGERRFAATADSFFLSQAFERVWARKIGQLPGPAVRIKRVGVTLHGLVAEGAVARDPFDTAAAAAGREELCRRIDALNAKYGRDSVSIGVTADFTAPYTGAKIAFSRIPDTEEFHE